MPYGPLRPSAVTASPEQLAAYHDAERYSRPRELRRRRVVTWPVEACAATRERLAALVETTDLKIVLSPEFLSELRQSCDN